MGLIVVVDDQWRQRWHGLEDGKMFFDRVIDAMGFLSCCWTIGETIDELWLDHDLGTTSILPLVDWLQRMGFYAQLHDDPELLPKVDRIFVHSMNPVGAVTVCNALTPYYSVRRAPLPDTDLESLYG